VTVAFIFRQFQRAVKLAMSEVGMAAKRILLSSIVLAFALGGCGTYVPAIQEFWEGPSPDAPFLSAGGDLEYKIKQKVYCDIVAAVRQNASLLPRHWAVQVTLDLQVDESSALNPGVAWNTVLPNVLTRFPSGTVTSPQSFSLGFGGTLSSQGTREDKFGNYWNLDKLRHFNGGTCPEAPQPGSSLLLESELGISQWLRDHLVAEVLLPSSAMSAQSDPAFKQDILSYHVKFIIISSGSITPTWKLVRISTGNGSLPLASINRTRTHDLLITFGPAFKPGTANVALSSHLAQEIGIEVSNGNRSVLQPTP
jgi:hypothetical protein